MDFQLPCLMIEFHSGCESDATPQEIAVTNLEKKNIATMEDPTIQQWQWQIQSIHLPSGVIKRGKWKSTRNGGFQVGKSPHL